jgi:hypothetical protein
MGEDRTVDELINGSISDEKFGRLVYKHMKIAQPRQTVSIPN